MKQLREHMESIFPGSGAEENLYQYNWKDAGIKIRFGIPKLTFHLPVPSEYDTNHEIYQVKEAIVTFLKENEIDAFLWAKGELIPLSKKTKNTKEIYLVMNEEKKFPTHFASFSKTYTNISKNIGYVLNENLTYDVRLEEDKDMGVPLRMLSSKQEAEEWMTFLEEQEIMFGSFMESLQNIKKKREYQLRFSSALVWNDSRGFICYVYCECQYIQKNIHVFEFETLNKEGLEAIEEFLIELDKIKTLKEKIYYLIHRFDSYSIIQKETLTWLNQSKSQMIQFRYEPQTKSFSFHILMKNWSNFEGTPEEIITSFSSFLEKEVSKIRLETVLQKRNIFQRTKMEKIFSSLYIRDWSLEDGITMNEVEVDVKSFFDGNIDITNYHPKEGCFETHRFLYQKKTGSHSTISVTRRENHE